MGSTAGENLTTPGKQYDWKLSQFAFMKPQGPHMPVTEAAVHIPPALWIRDDEGALWSLGFDYNEAEWRGGKYEYDVVRTGPDGVAVKTGEFARTIEFTVPPNGNKRVVQIWGADGKRRWNGRAFV